MSTHGLNPQTIADIVDRDVDWSAVRGCYERAENAVRVARYRDRVATSTDPLCEPDVLARREVAGLRVQAELRRRDRMLRLRRRLRATHAPISVVAAPDNVVNIGRRQ